MSGPLVKHNSEETGPKVVCLTPNRGMLNMYGLTLTTYAVDRNSMLVWGLPLIGCMLIRGPYCTWSGASVLGFTTLKYKIIR